MIFSRASLRRSSRTRTRKNSLSMDADDVCLSPRSSISVRRKTRPPPLQIIPELSENELSIDATHSPTTARPMQFTPRQPALVSSRVTLSAYAFSIDDVLHMFGGDAPRSPALSASSSTSDGASSSDVPATPRTSDDEDGYNFVLHTPRLRPQHVSIRPLCITKTRSLVCQDGEDSHDYSEKEDKDVSLPATDEISQRPVEADSMKSAEEAERDFYAREFEDFISFSAIPSPTSPARRDSLILVAEALPTVIEVPQSKSRGRSRHSKPLPLLPPVTPPASTFPPIPTFSLVQTTAQKSAVRRKRNIPSPPHHVPSPPTVSRPLPRVAVPLDIEDCVFPEESLDVSSCESTITGHAEEDASIYSQPSLSYSVPPTARLLSPAIPETPLVRMYGEVILPRSSTDSDAPRSSTDSTLSFASSTSSNTPITSTSIPSSPSSEERLRSRWSTSTLGSIAAEPPRTTTLLSPLRGVFGTRTRRTPLPSQKTPPRLSPSRHPKGKQPPLATPSPPSNSGRHIRRQGSQSSTSSTGSECDSHDGSPGRLKRKPIPVAMFLRAA